MEGKIIVTGGAGFIGSALVWALNGRGIDDIVVVDRLDHSDKWRNLSAVRFNDYLDADELSSVISENKLDNIKAILHLGACSSTTETDSKYLMENNYAYTRNLATWAVAHDVRFIYASSAATYGDGSAGMEDGVDELQRFRPLNAYGFSKHLFDLYAHKHGLLDVIVGLKYFNVYGPNENHKDDMRSLVNKAYEQIQQTGRINLFKSYHADYEDGEFGRDFLYVKDAVAMTLHFLENKVGGLFNVGAGESHTWNELAQAIFGALSLPPQIEYIEMPENLRGRYQYHTLATLNRLLQSGYGKPLTPFREAITDYVINYLVPHKSLGDET